MRTRKRMRRGASILARVTLKQISELTGYSQATVSNVLNQKKEANEKTVKKIFDAAKELGYTSSKKMERIILVMYRKSGEILLETPLILGLIDGVEKEGQKHHIETSIMNIYMSDSDHEAKISSLLNETKSGIILLATELEWKDIEPFKKLKVPFVVVDAWYREGNFTTVLMENRNSFQQAVSYLVSKGHTKIGYIGSTIPIRNFEEREQGFRDAMAEHHLKIEEKYCVKLQPTMTGAQISMKKYLKKEHELPTAYVAVNDIIALGAMKALKDMQYRIPDDVSIIGFDNMPFCEISSPPLTTFNVLKDEIGRTAARLLLNQSESQERIPMKLEILTDFIERDSVKSIKIE